METSKTATKVTSNDLASTTKSIAVKPPFISALNDSDNEDVAIMGKSPVSLPSDEEDSFLKDNLTDTTSGESKEAKTLLLKENHSSSMSSITNKIDKDKDAKANKSSTKDAKIETPSAKTKDANSKPETVAKINKPQASRNEMEDYEAEYYDEEGEYYDGEEYDEGGYYEESEEYHDPQANEVSPKIAKPKIDNTPSEKINKQDKEAVKVDVAKDAAPKVVKDQNVIKDGAKIDVKDKQNELQDDALGLEDEALELEDEDALELEDDAGLELESDEKEAIEDGDKVVDRLELEEAEKMKIDASHKPNTDEISVNGDLSDGDNDDALSNQNNPEKDKTDGGKQKTVKDGSIEDVVKVMPLASKGEEKVVIESKSVDENKSKMVESRTNVGDRVELRQKDNEKDKIMSKKNEKELLIGIEKNAASKDDQKDVVSKIDESDAVSKDDEKDEVSKDDDKDVVSKDDDKDVVSKDDENDAVSKDDQKDAVSIDSEKDEISNDDEKDTISKDETSKDNEKDETSKDEVSKDDGKSEISKDDAMSVDDISLDEVSPSDAKKDENSSQDKKDAVPSLDKKDAVPTSLKKKDVVSIVDDDDDDVVELIDENEASMDGIEPVVEMNEPDEPLNVKSLQSQDSLDEIPSDDDFDPSSLLAVVHDDEDERITIENDSSSSSMPPHSTPPVAEKVQEEKSSVKDDKKTVAEVSDDELSDHPDNADRTTDIIKSVVNKMVNKILKPVEPPSAPKEKGQEKCLPTDEKSCAECKINKGLKYQVLFQGRTHFLCSDYCFHIFRNKQKLAPPPSTVIPRRDKCTICTVEIKNGQGYFPLDSESSKPVCSEACIKKYQQEHGAKQTCAQCKANIEGRTKCLTWETMEFCNEDCLGKYQTFLGSFCACCKSPVQRLSLGKYCVRFGFDIRQFCSGKCLEEFKKGLKVCTFCQKDLTGSTDGFLAPVGSKGQFKDFCSQECMSQYETVNLNTNKTPVNKQCSVCKKTGPVKVQVTFENKEHVLCSDPCVASFRYANKIFTKICDTCNKFFKTESSPLQFEGSSKRFCSKACMNLFVLSHRKIVPCTWCKVKKYNFDMIERVDSNNHVQLFCSLNCLSLFRVSLNATSSRSIQCDHCKNFLPAQYHLTMSDASIRNFCTYQCVIQFQNQFTSVPTLTTVTSTPKTNTAAPLSSVAPKLALPPHPMPQQQQQQQSTISTTPVISSVISLAPSPVMAQQQQQQQQHAPKNLLNTSVVVGGAKGSLGTMQMSLKNSLPMVSRGPMGTLQPQQQPITTMANRNNNQPTNNYQLAGAARANKNSTNLVTFASTAATNTGTATTGGTAVHVMREIVVRPTQPKIMKNKMVLCKPMMQTKGVACKPHPCHKCTQTDAEPKIGPQLIPIPVPIFIPVPMHMYSRPVPFPLPFVLPVPVPIFLPTTKSTTEQIAKDIKEIKDKIPDNPFEAELLMMAEMVAAGENNNSDDKPFSFISEASKSSCDNACSPGGGGTEEAPDDLESMLAEPILDLETALAIPTFASQFERHTLEEAEPVSMASLSSVADESSSEKPSPSTRKSRKSSTKKRKKVSSKSKSRKKAKVVVESDESYHPTDDEDESNLISQQETSAAAIAIFSTNDTSNTEVALKNAAALAAGLDQSGSPDANLCLKFMFGVNAWKHWVVQKNDQLERGSQTRKLKLFKTDLLQLTADELNYSLCLFVKEVRKPNGEEYAPDSIYYLCLGIQMYLFENTRVDNIFTDSYYEKFTECLNEVVQKQEAVVISREGHYVSRIEEEILWESKQLGAHSPHVLLNTLMYFNTKFFMLKSVEDHLRLNFSQIMKHWRKTSTAMKTGVGANEVTIPSGTKMSVLRYYPPVVKVERRNKKEEPLAYEQLENLQNVLRCPVKLYEFYLSKCVKTRSDVFYLYPERSCVPDSPVWYSAQPLGRETICKMLHRIRMVREICNPFSK